MDELTRAARPLVEHPPIERPSVAALEQRASRRHRRRAGAVAVVAVVVLIGAGVVLFGAGSDETIIRTADTIATETDGRTSDLAIFMDADATDAEVEAVRQAVLDDPNAIEVRELTQDDAMVHFRCLFSDSPEMLASVTAADLPFQFRVFTDEAPTESANPWTRFESYPGVLKLVVRNEAGEVLPAPAEPELRAALEAAGFNPDEWNQPYASPPVSDCGLQGELIKPR
jgi:hypothetical protein